MLHRLERMASVVRQVVGEAIMARISDPRVSRFTSVTRVEISADLAFADVHVSVMGSEADERTTLRGLGSARGMIQSLLAKQLSTRSCPTLRFHLDDSIKKGIDMVREIDRLAPKPDAAPDDRAAADDSGPGAGADS
jgi:ribosome-binding factor A